MNNGIDILPLQDLVIEIEAIEELEKRQATIFSCGYCNEKNNSILELKDHLYFLLQKFLSGHSSTVLLNKHKEAMENQLSEQAPTFQLDVEENLVRNPKEIIKCDLCFTQFKHQKYLKNHKLLVHEARKKFECDSCDKVLSKESNLEAHKRRFHWKEKGFSDIYECDNCFKQFRVHEDLKVHIKSIHERASQSFNCPLCPKTFAIEQNMKRHFKRMHQRIKRIKCDSCDMAFQTPRELKVHADAVHFTLTTGWN